MTQSTDPYALLGAELARAAEALDQGDAPAATERRSHARRLRRWSSRHILATVLVTGTAVASATAGVVAALSGTASRPPAGALVVPATTPGGTSRVVGSYRVSFSPWTAVGQVAWCTHVQLRTLRDGGSGGAGCGPAATRRTPFIGGGALTGPNGVDYAIVDERVAVLAGPRGQRLIPRTDPTLPSGWKYAIALHEQTSPATPRSHLNDLYSWTPLDAAGKRVGGPPLSPNHDAANFVGKQPVLRVRSGGGPPGGSCAIARRDGAPWRRGHAIYRVLARPAKSAPEANGRPFLTCAQVTIPTIGHRLVASVLIDAKDPGRRPATLPGLTAGIDGLDHLGDFGPSFGIVGSHTLDLSARRVGNAWLVVLGLRPRERGDLIRALTVQTNLP